MEESSAAAKAAGADEFIKQMAEGYEAIIGERGYDLSGGQRQRVSIARLLVTDPTILILDDATSSVDVQIEQEIHDALHGVMEGRTTLVIAHRLSTINLADRVVLMERGRIVASGAHSELMRTEPRYVEVLAHLREDEEALLARREKAEGNGFDSDADEVIPRHRSVRWGWTVMGMFGPGRMRRPDVWRRSRTHRRGPVCLSPGSHRSWRRRQNRSSTTEPEHPPEQVTFDRIPPDDRPFTLRRFLAPHKWWLARLLPVRRHRNGCDAGRSVAYESRHRQRNPRARLPHPADHRCPLYGSGRLRDGRRSPPAGLDRTGRRAPHVPFARTDLHAPAAAGRRLVHRARRRAGS